MALRQFRQDIRPYTAVIGKKRGSKYWAWRDCNQIARGPCEAQVSTFERIVAVLQSRKILFCDTDDADASS